ncbi:MAG: hypothetical protein KKF89_01030 [Nanoarchaeota archaeon]|nr:hypothetical protein [Nanoarchaeota archaeon]
MNEWQYYHKRNMSVFTTGLYMFGVGNFSNLLLKTRFNPTKLRYVGGTGYRFMPDYNNLLKIVRQKSVSEIKSFAEKCVDDCENLLAYSEKLKKSNFKNMSLLELEEIYNDFIAKYVLVTPYWDIIHPFADVLEEDIKKIIPEEFAAKLFILKKITVDQKEKNELLELALEMQKNNLSVENFSKLKKHIEKYCWLGMDHLRGYEWNLDSYKDRLKLILETDVSEQIKYLKQNNEKTLSDYNEVIKKLNIQSELLDKIDLVTEFIFLRTYRKEAINHINHNFLHLLNEIACRFNLSLDDLLFLSHEEIGKLFEIKNQIIKRRKNFNILFEDGKLMISTEKICMDDGVVDTNEIKGVIANKGYVKGKVTVVRNLDELKNVEKGDVLVTYMTTPDFIVAMERAAAFVTDEGGITCHAAIVSREMNKPCIMNTKIATSVLKNGDMVEVDADKGIIRKL